MSADNSADKPQFVENQMLTHDSLNDLVEFSAGRTKRVMKALGLGGTVSGVSWSFDKQEKIISITPGFIIFPDGEVVEIAKPLTFNDIGTGGVLRYQTTPPTPPITAPNHLRVSYKWATDGHRGECFSTASNPYKVQLTWELDNQLSGSAHRVSPKLFQPLLLPTEGSLTRFIKDSLNTKIGIYNSIVAALNDEKLLDYKLMQIPTVKSSITWGIGICGDISFELSYFAKRLMIAANGLLRNRTLNAVGRSSNIVRLGVANTVGQYLPAEIDSLLFEVFLSHKVVSASIIPFISQMNESRVFPRNVVPFFPENPPQGIYASRKNTSVSGVFLNTTAKVLSEYCDTVYTTSVDDFYYVPKRNRMTQLELPEGYTKVSAAPHHLISSFSHISNHPSYLVERDSEDHGSPGIGAIINDTDHETFLGFIKPYRDL